MAQQYQYRVSHRTSLNADTQEDESQIEESERQSLQLETDGAYNT